MPRTLRFHLACLFATACGPTPGDTDDPATSTTSASTTTDASPTSTPTTSDTAPTTSDAAPTTSDAAPTSTSDATSSTPTTLTTDTTTGDPFTCTSAPEFATPASSTRETNLVTSSGPGPQFVFPELWLAWFAEHANNLHLTRSELELVRTGTGDWDAEYSHVLTSLFDFDRCAAHVGGEGWGADAVSYADLQLRAYVLDELPADILARIDAAPWTLVDANVLISPGDPWQQVLLTWDNFYGDYGGPAALDLRIRRFTSATVVLAGMYSDDWSAALDEIVASTCWTPGTGECCPDE